MVTLLLLKNLKMSVQSNSPTTASSFLVSLSSSLYPLSYLDASTAEEIMELLSAAQKYQKDSILARIRDRLSRQDPPFICAENAFHIYSLAPKYGLRDEAHQAARTSLSISMTFDDLDEQLKIMPGSYFYELWKYHQRVRGNLLLNLLGFRTTGVRASSAGSTNISNPW
jgi:hypothetical protein